MDDDIIRMAQEAQQERLSLDGRSVPSTALSGYWVSMEVADLARFAALVRADEREACARACEGQDEADARFRYDYRRGVCDCADAIRARAQQPPATVEDRLARHGIPMPGDPK